MTRRKIDNRWHARLKRFFTAKRPAIPSDVHIDLYASCWNEERVIPFFLRHYEPIVDRIVIFDDGSNDRSLELLKASPKVELRQLKRGESSILMQTEEMNHCWKESRGRADWVIICDMDEHIYHHKELCGYLAQCKANGSTILNPVGVDMVSVDFPAPDVVLSEAIRSGVRSFLLDKKAVFNPNEVDEINYGPGRHAADPLGRLIFPPKREVKLLHYKALGFDYLLDRTQQLRERKTSFDLERGWGLHDHRPAEDVRLGFDEMLQAAKDISLIGKKRPTPLQSDEDQRKV